MPKYSYACKTCDHTFDVQQSFSDAALTKCPECAGELRKVFGAVGITFKGSGFYRTDSAVSAKTSAGTNNPAATKDSTPSAKAAAPAATASATASNSAS